MSQTVSIIIPVYNTEAYLSRCLNSVLQQTYAALEILLIDDGSTDTSGRLCDTFAAQDPRIRVVHKTNGGVSSARNTGLHLATGDYLIFLDSDDYVDASWIETMMYQLEKEQADISVCTFSNEEVPGVFVPYFNGEKKPYIFDGETQISNLLQNKYYSCSLCDKLFKRAILQSLSFDEAITHYEDLWFLYQGMKRSAKLVFYPEPLYYYCTNQGSASTGQFSDKMMTMITVCERIYNEAPGNTALFSVVRKEFVRNNVMCAINAANSGYTNREAIARMRANVKKEWWHYLTHPAPLGYKVNATLLVWSWPMFRQFVKRYMKG